MNQPAIMPEVIAAAIPIPIPAFTPTLIPAGGGEATSVLNVDVDSAADVGVDVSAIVEDVVWVELVVSVELVDCAVLVGCTMADAAVPVILK
jgi:hypothetical protein